MIEPEEEVLANLKQEILNEQKESPHLSKSEEKLKKEISIELELE